MVLTLTYFNGLKVLWDYSFYFSGGQITRQSCLILVSIFPVRIFLFPLGKLEEPLKKARRIFHCKYIDTPVYH